MRVQGSQVGMLVVLVAVLAFIGAFSQSSGVWGLAVLGMLLLALMLMLGMRGRASARF